MTTQELQEKWYKRLKELQSEADSLGEFEHYKLALYWMIRTDFKEFRP